VERRRIFCYAELFAFALLILLKHLLVRDQLLTALVAPHDDYLFARLSDYLARGEWLGPFDNRTLIKGMVYSLFLAAIKAVHLPPLFAQQALYAIACMVAVFALRPLLPSRWLRVAAFGVLLFFPGDYALARLLRDGIYSSLVLFVLSGGIGLVLRPRATAAQATGWSALFAVSAAAFWFTREESIWLAPSMAILSIVLAFQARRGAALAPWLAIGAAWLAIATANYTHYGLFAPRDILTREFKDAYGALLRLHTADIDIRVPVPAVARAKLYPLSPAFRELQPSLDGQHGRNWASIFRPWSATSTVIEIEGAHFIWAFRDAVEMAGYYTNAAAANAYYRRLAAEINDACDRGLVEAGPPHSGLAMPWHFYYARPFLGTAVKGAETFLSLPVRPGPRASSGSEDGQKFLHRTILGTFAPLNIPPPAPWVSLTAENVRRDIARFYSIAFRWLLAASIVAAGIAFLRGGQRWIPGVLSFALLLAVGIRMVMLVYIDMSSFDILRYPYMAPVYMPAFLFCALAWGWFLAARKGGAT
jgi:hypothetical protein